MGGDLVQRAVAPFLRFGEQLPAVLGMKRGALAVQGLHRAAVNEFFHRHLPGSVGDTVSPLCRRCHNNYATERLPYRRCRCVKLSSTAGLTRIRRSFDGALTFRHCRTAVPDLIGDDPAIHRRGTRGYSALISASLTT